MQNFFTEDRFGTTFPSCYCQGATRAVLMVTRLDQVAGFYSDAREEEMISHAWNFDPKLGLYINLTLAQFGSYPLIAVLRADRYTILEEDSDRTRVLRNASLEEAELVVRNLHKFL